MSLKQLILNMSAEARAEIRKFLDELEGVEAIIVPAVPEAEAQVEQAQDVQPAEDNSAEVPSETPAA